MTGNSDSQAILSTLRQVLKTKKLTYADVANRLGVSEQTIKRLFGGGDAPLSRLIDICNVADVSIYDVVQLSNDGGDEYFSLTEEQEQFFADYPHYLRFFYELLEKHSLDHLATTHAISLSAAQKYLRELDRMGLVERLEGDRYNVKVRGSHNWLRDGPLYRRNFLHTIDQLFDFLTDPVRRGSGSHQTMSQTRISQETKDNLIADVKELATRYRKIAQRESNLLPADQLVDTLWLMIVAAPYKEAARDKIVEV